MPRNLSPAFHRAATALAPLDESLTALEITHPELVIPIRVVNDSQAATIENNRYTALRFDAVFADDQPGQAPRAQLRIDNVGRVLTEPLAAIGGGAGASVRVISFMRSAPENIEFEVTMDLTDVTIDPLTVTASLGFDALLSRAAVSINHDPAHSPGLF